MLALPHSASRADFAAGVAPRGPRDAFRVHVGIALARYGAGARVWNSLREPNVYRDGHASGVPIVCSPHVTSRARGGEAARWARTSRWATPARRSLAPHRSAFPSPNTWLARVCPPQST